MFSFRFYRAFHPLVSLPAATACLYMYIYWMEPPVSYPLWYTFIIIIQLAFSMFYISLIYCDWFVYAIAFVDLLFPLPFYCACPSQSFAPFLSFSSMLNDLFPYWLLPVDTTTTCLLYLHASLERYCLISIRANIISVNWTTPLYHCPLHNFYKQTA